MVSLYVSDSPNVNTYPTRLVTTIHVVSRGVTFREFPTYIRYGKSTVHVSSNMDTVRW